MLHPRAKFINLEDFARMCIQSHLTESENTAGIFSRVSIPHFLELHSSLAWVTMTVVLPGGILFFENQREYNDWVQIQEF